MTRHRHSGPLRLTNEFAAVEVSLDLNANGPRLQVEDLSHGDRAYLDPVELASFCRATEQQRRRWLEVGEYVASEEALPNESEARDAR